LGLRLGQRPRNRYGSVGIMANCRYSLGPTLCRLGKIDQRQVATLSVEFGQSTRCAGKITLPCHGGGKGDGPTFQK